MNQTLLPTDLRSEGEVVSHYTQLIQKKIVAKRVVLGVGVVVILAAAVPIIILAIQSGLALLAAGGLFLGGIFSWKCVPYWMLRQENRIRELMMREQNEHLARLKAEARKNPIEQAENDYLRRSKQYQAFKAALETIGGQVKSFRTKLESTKRNNPNFDLSQEFEALKKMELFYNNRLERLGVANTKLAEFRLKINEARAKWEFALQANDAIRAMNATDQDACIQEILTEVSFDAVHQQFDSIFAKLDVDAAEISTKQSLNFGSEMTIDLPTLEINDLVLVMGGES